VTLHRSIRKEKPNGILELGVNYGFSTYGVLSALAANGKGVLVSIDRNEFALKGKRTGHLVPESLKGFWELKIGETGDFLSSLGTFDMIFEDFDVHEILKNDFEEKALPAIWSALNHAGFLHVSSTVVKPAIDAFAREKGGWLAKTEGVKTAMASCGILRKLKVVISRTFVGFRTCPFNRVRRIFVYRT
jgi:hypothetical protein